MQLIKDKDQILINIESLEGYLTEGNEYEKKEATLLVKRGICFIAYKIDTEIRFAPSRFIGYIDNKLDIHFSDKNIDGRDTNKAIIEILGNKPIPNTELEIKYIDYCNKLGIRSSEKGTYGVQRKFWVIDIENEFEKNLQVTGAFPEGKLVERLHIARERNYQVISHAKQNFANKNGRVFCQVCGFDFENVYGDLGKGFIEGHHTIAVSDMTSDHKTKIEDIAMVCPNCHRMLHKKRPWLTMNDLNNILIKE